jgi:hypothetical protein
MKTVYKYVLNPYNPETELPIGAIIRKVHTQNGEICIWAEVDTEAITEFRNFHVFGTGHEIPYNMGINYHFLDTVFLGSLVFHVYERLGL